MTRDRQVQYGEITEERQGQINVSSMNMKALSKLVNIAPTATVKIYTETNRPVKILCPIGHLGTLRIYLFPNVL